MSPDVIGFQAMSRGEGGVTKSKTKLNLGVLKPTKVESFDILFDLNVYFYLGIFIYIEKIKYRFLLYFLRQLYVLTWNAASHMR